MFDLLAKIAELLLKIPKAYQEQHDLKRKREFGQDLITCYLRLLEVTYTAEEILSQLEFFTRRFKKHLELNDDWVYWTGELRSHLEKQSLNIIRLGHSMQSIAEELFVLLPETSREIETLARGKRNAISTLSKILACGEMPIYFNVDMAAARSTHGAESLLGRSVTTESDWNEDVYEQVQAYLDSDVIYERVAKLKECAVQLRTLLSDNFRIEDILWSVDKFRDHTTFLM